jgi:hypothetical protein
MIPGRFCDRISEQIVSVIYRPTGLIKNRNPDILIVSTYIYKARAFRILFQARPLRGGNQLLRKRFKSNGCDNENR